MASKTLDKLKITLRFIHDFIKENSYPPSVREICAEAGFKSTASAQYYLTKLENDGYIRKSASKNRTIEIVEEKYREMFDLPAEREETVFEETQSTLEVPLLGNVAAGAPLLAAVNVDESLPLPKAFFRCKEPMFLLTVNGNSMINAGIFDGDVVLIKQQQVARTGEIIVAQIDNEEVTLKRFYPKQDCVVLRPENDAMEDIVVTPDHEFRILGVAAGLMRNRIF